MKKLKVIDLFSGVGGLSYGFCKNPHFKIIAANEILEDMAKAYGLNHGDALMYNTDIKNFSKSILQKDIKEDVDVDIVVGGPPCQAYSTVGKRIIDDPRGKLFQEYFRLLKEFRPKLFLFENVRGLLSLQGGELFDTITELFSSLGYKVQHKILNAANFGVPQMRERVIIIGSLLNSNYKYPQPTHSNSPAGLFDDNYKPFLTLKDALSDLPLIKSGEFAGKYCKDPQNEYQRLMRSGSDDILTEHNSPLYNKKLQTIMDALKDGEDGHNLPLEIRPTSGFLNTYAKLWWNKPSTTITRNLGTPSSSRCIHPKIGRALTTREGARLQSFPDDFLFYGSRISKNLQIGNAVPPLLSHALAKSIEQYFLSSSQEKTGAVRVERVRA
jgi:DNA (cytosine-5)-methyltransferase 1